jgi:HME family heavy-metal exporter
VALLPLLVDPGSPGKEILHPVAVTIFGGLLTATLLDALLTPLLFERFGEKPLRRFIAARKQPASAGAPAPAEAF